MEIIPLDIVLYTYVPLQVGLQMDNDTSWRDKPPSRLALIAILVVATCYSNQNSVTCHFDTAKQI